MFKCDKCKRKATYNVQESVVVWSIDKDGYYSDNPIEYREINGDNEHLCDKHYEEN